MMERSAFMVLLALASTVTPANASDWRLVELDRTKATAVDVSGIERSNGTAKAWTALMLPLTVSGMDYALTRSEFDCEKRTVKRLSVVSYDSAGNVLGRDDQGKTATASAARPAERLLLRAVCAGEFLHDAGQGWPNVFSLFETYRSSPGVAPTSTTCPEERADQ